jgi:hypothetical protein
MKNILTAIYGKFANSALSADVGGRIFLDQAPDDCEFPYVVYFIVAANQEKTFTENFTNTLIQFSLFSASEGVTEITGMYADLKTLFDECALTIAGNSLVWMREQNLTTMIEDITTADASQRVKHWAVDFEIKTSLN